MKVLILIFALIFSLSYAISPKDVIEGKAPLTSEMESELYEEYIKQYSSHWMSIFNDFKSSEVRKEIFAINLRMIIYHNLNSKKTYTKGINKFTGLFPEERNNYILRSPQNCSATALETLKSINLRKQKSINVPTTQDWRTKGVVSEVKDQGNCGSCWTFSTTGCLESHWAIYTKQTPPLLSEQQLVDCAGNFNNFGCNGGLPAQAFEYIRYNGGLDTEEVYPYEGQDGSCRFVKSGIGAKVPGGSVNITAYNEEELLEAVGNVGPVSIAFEVTNGFEAYSGGIFSDPECHQDPQHVNHAVLVVGYGSEGGVNYWIVKNSWGPSWGENGYFRIIRGNNECGLATCASYPNVNA